MLKLIVGLGNPGVEYGDTRHNAGTWFVEALARSQGLSLRSTTKFHGLSGSLESATHPYHLLIPTTYMNHSGTAVAAMARFYKINATEILVVHDELDFPTGQIRLKIGGGHGGHNGVRDIISHLGSADFVRLRIGIGHPRDRYGDNKNQVLSYVLGRPDAKEREQIETAIVQGLTVLDDLIQGRFEQAMRYLHC